MRFSFLVAALSVCAALDAPAASRCIETEKYVAVIKDLKGGIGESISVFSKAEKSDGCKRVPKSLVFRWDRKGKADNDAFGTIVGDYLTVTSGTDVDSNTTFIIDLVKKAKIVEVPQAVKIEGDVASYASKQSELQVTGQSATCAQALAEKLAAWAKKNEPKVNIALECDCAKLIAETGNAVVELKYKVNLKTLAREVEAKATCSFFQ